jgi:hypothetical protein
MRIIVDVHHELRQLLGRNLSSIQQMGIAPWSLGLGTQSGTKFADGLMDGFEGLTRALLNPPVEFVLFSLCELEIIVGEASPLLFEIPLDDVPIAFDL